MSGNSIRSIVEPMAGDNPRHMVSTSGSSGMAAHCGKFDDVCLAGLILASEFHSIHTGPLRRIPRIRLCYLGSFVCVDDGCIDDGWV
jgi:hypothetical protein